MSDWLAAIPNLSVPGVPGVNDANSATYGQCSGVPASVPGVPEHLSGTPGTPRGTQHTERKAMKNKQEHPEHQEHRQNSVPERTTEARAKALLRDWHRHLSEIDQFTSPPAWSLNDWLRLTDDAMWLYEQHASYAVRNGWTAHDLFAVRPGMPHLGGLAVMLKGARDLKLVGGKAYWTISGVKHRINVGAGDGEGAVLLWEIV